MFKNIAKSKIGIVLAILFGLSLFFMRQSSTISGIFNSDNIVAKVGDTPITTSKFVRTLDMNIQQFNRMLDKNLSSEEIRNYQIHNLALNALINDAVFENEFDKLNFILDERIIAEKTKEMIPQLYDDNNNLDEEYLEQFLSQQRLAIEDIVQIVNYDTRNKFFNDSLLDVKYPANFSQKIQLYNNHNREIEYLKIPINLININNQVQKDKNSIDKILLEFYENNINNYMIPEKRDVEYIQINYENYKDNFIPTENEIYNYYTNNNSLFLENEKRSFLQFNFKNYSEAESIQNYIINIPTFDEILLYANKNNIKYNIFDNLTKDEILEEIANSLFSLNINQQSPIIKSPLGSHIVVLKSIKPKKQLTLDETKNKIIKTISSNNAKNYLIDLESEISEDILNGANIADIADKNGLKLLFIKELTKESNDFDIKEKDKILIYNLINESFQANLDYTSDIINLDDNSFFIFKVTQIHDSKPENLNNIKDIVNKDWERYQKIKKIENIIVSDNKNINLINKLKNQYSLESKKLIINSSNNFLPGKLISNIFSNDINTLTYIIDDNNLHLSKIDKIDFNHNLIEKIDDTPLINEFRNNLYEEFLKSVKISTNDRLINTILNSY